jgi:hypothetical protein
LAGLPRRGSRSGPAARSRRSTSACRRTSSGLTALRAPTDTCRSPRAARATIAGRAVARRAIRGSVAPRVREGSRRAFLARGTRPEAHCATEHKAKAKSWEHVSHAPQSTPRVTPGKGRPAAAPLSFRPGSPSTSPSP